MKEITNKESSTTVVTPARVRRLSARVEPSTNHRVASWQPEPASLDAKQERQTYTVDEVAVVLGIGRNGAYEAIWRHEIPAIRLGRRLLVPKVAIDRLLLEASSSTPPAAKAQR
jgi:excisionase family DNA binding protein